jgi:membrane protease YdiL (CAAX protease family)
MSETDGSSLSRVTMFTALMAFIVMLSPLLTAPFVGTEMYGLVGTGLFFLTFLLIYIVVHYFVKLEGGSSIAELGADLEDKELFPHFLKGLIAGALASALVVIIALAFGGDLRPSAEITGDLIASEIIITVPTAFFEELAYRGYLMPRMADLWGKGKGIIISSLIFSLLHFGWWLPLGSVPLHLIVIFTFNIMLGGIVLSLSYFLSGNKLWVPIGFHFSWNMIAYLMFPTYPREPVILPEIYQIEWGITTILGFLFGLTVLWLLLQQKKNKE